MNISKNAKRLLYTGLLTTSLLFPTIAARAEDYPAALQSEALSTSTQSSTTSDPEWRYVPIRRISS